MKAELIFYLSDKTNLNQEQLKKNLSRYGVELNTVKFAADYPSLVKRLKEALGCGRMIFIVGGLLKLGEINTIRVLSKALRIPLLSDYPPILKGSMLLGDKHFNSGCVLESETQSITVLPDNPYSIRSVFEGKLHNFLMKKYYLVDRQKEEALALAERSMRSGKMYGEDDEGQKVILNANTINEILQMNNIDIEDFSEPVPQGRNIERQAPEARKRVKSRRKFAFRLLFILLAAAVMLYAAAVTVIAFPTLKEFAQNNLSLLFSNYG